MAGSMKLFRLFREYHQIIGITSCSMNQNQWLRRAIYLTSSTQLVFSTVAFLVIESSSIFERGFVFYVITFLINVTVIFVLFIWQQENTLKFIENCDAFIAKSKHSYRKEQTITFNYLFVHFFRRHFKRNNCKN